MKLVIRETGVTVGRWVGTATTFLQRLRGLLGTEFLPEGFGLHIEPCRSVHTFFMKYPVDVLHLDENRRIVGIEPNLAPGKIGRTFAGTHSVVELPAGMAERSGVEVGQTIEFHDEQEEKAG